MASSGSIGLAILAQLLMVLLYVPYAGACPAFYAEIFPTRVRYTALSIGYNTAVAIFGGFAPFIATYLIKLTGYPLAPTFYVFNGLMLFTFFLMFQRYGEFLLWLTVRLALVSVLLQVVIAFLARQVIGRSTVMFNNPNQLGYYALLSACVLLLGQKRLRLSTVKVTLGLAACSYLALLSAG